MTPCPAHSEWPRLLDGVVEERRAQHLRAHATGCPPCARRLARAAALLDALARPAVEPDPARVARLMAHLDAANPPRPVLVPRLAIAAAAMALAVVAWVGLRPDPGTFTPRGSSAGWPSKVHAELRVLSDVAHPVAADAGLSSSTAITVWYRNVETSRDLFVLAYLLDGVGEAHWVAPAWPEARQGAPVASRLPRAEGVALFEESFVPESPAPGRGQLVAVICPEPRSTGVVEAAPPPRRGDAEALFPGCVVWRQPIVVLP